jgi:Probable lipoprotein LpqN
MRASAITRVAVTCIALAVVLSGCGSDTKTATATSSETTASKVIPPSAPAAPAAGTNPTIADYIKDNGITETPINMGDPSAPTVNLPVPDGWKALTEADVPHGIYGGIVYTGPEYAADPPKVLAVFSKLTGNLDPQKIIDLAPGELNNLAGYTPGNKGEKSTLGDYPSYLLDGTWVDNGTTRVIAQKTVVIPAPDGLYVLQLNAYGTEASADILHPATEAVDSSTTIS